MNDGTGHRDSIIGAWHLVDVGANEVDLPQHRVDLVIRIRESSLTGAILSRLDGREAGVLVIELDGSTLRLQMRVGGADSPADPPWLVLTRTGERFEGQWRNAEGEPVGPMLKMIRARQE